MNNLKIAYTKFLIEQNNKFLDISSFDASILLVVGNYIQVNFENLFKILLKHQKISTGLLLTPIDDKNLLDFLTVIANNRKSAIDATFKEIFTNLIKNRKNVFPIYLYGIKKINNINFTCICYEYISGEYKFFSKSLSDVICSYNVLPYLTFFNF